MQKHLIQSEGEEALDSLCPVNSSVSLLLLRCLDVVIWPIRNPYKALNRHAAKDVWTIAVHIEQCHGHSIKSCSLLPTTYQIDKIAIMTQIWRIRLDVTLESRGSKQTNENVRRKMHSLPCQCKWPAGGLSDNQYPPMQIKASLVSPTERNENSYDIHYAYDNLVT